MVSSLHSLFWLQAYEQYPDDADVAAIYAESLINLSPWDYYSADDKNHVRPILAPALTALRRSLSLDGNHLLALHMWIHLIEASSSPGDAEKEADRLYSIGRGLSSNSRLLQLQQRRRGEGVSTLEYKGTEEREESDVAAVAAGAGHLLHMPAHVFLRVGRYKDAVDASILAVASDKMYRAKCLVPYVDTHNSAMMVYAATLWGRYEASS